MHIKVIDFGTSIQLDGEKLRTKLGTPYYIAPEVLRGEYDEECDVWSCGVILYILLCGYPPFNGESDLEIFELIKQGVYSFPSEDWDSVSPQAHNLVQKMLVFNPSERISAKEALNDPFLLKHYKMGQSRGSMKNVNTHALIHLQKFYAKQKLQAQIFQYIVNQMVTKEEERDLREIFKEMDLDGNGVLS